MEERVFHLLKFSYNNLPSLTHQVCFLLCALYPEDQLMVTESLIVKWIGLGYIDDFEDYEEALNKGYDIIGTLKHTCLLENVLNGDMFVKMHDVIRELALWIAREYGKEEGMVFAKSGHALTATPKTDLRPMVVQKISLINTNISYLEKLPSCPNLSIFLAPKNRCLNHIVDDFFLSMPALKLLDLSDSGITKVPTSICKLFELEYLDLSVTKITSLPYEMRNLTKLKYLSFARTEFLRIIPHGMMMNLSNLELLELQVPKLGDSDEEMSVDIDELRCLNQLKALEISISDLKVLENFLSDTRLCICTKYLGVSGCKEITLHLNLGHFKQLRDLVISDCSEPKDLLFDCITNNDETEVGLFESLERMVLKNLPKLVISWEARNLHCAHFRKLHAVFLSGCDAMVDLTWLLLIPNLQRLWIVECNSLQEIISSSDKSGGAYDPNTFSNLRTLFLIDLPNLQSICGISALPFQSLEIIHVTRCPKLRRLPLHSNSAKNRLKMIQGDEEWSDRLELENETINTQFENYRYGICVQVNVMD